MSLAAPLSVVRPPATLTLNVGGAVAGAPGGAGGPAAALPSQRVTSETTSIYGPILFFLLDRKWHKRVRLTTRPAVLDALYKEKAARRLCIAHGFCVAYYTHDRKFFTWHLYPNRAALLAHIEYLNYVFRNHGGCPPVAKLRLQGRLWTATEKLAFERRAYVL